MEFTDHRARRVAFVSSCILNQNTRAPANADQKAAATDVVTQLLENDVGIEQFPCPECVLWGGLARPKLYDQQPRALRAFGTWRFPIVKLFSRTWMFITGLRARRLINASMRRMDDFVAEGYEVVGVVGVDASPTCGVSESLDLIEVVAQLENVDVTPEAMAKPDFDDMGRLTLASTIKKPGYFMGGIARGLRKRNLNIPMAGVHPWKDAKAEARRISEALGLTQGS